ncbi:MAG: ATP-binding protein [Thermodesulfobacteriota bacterium]|nr:ATP-binding protein [Thermodesulfobacteriota bacterium]
MSENDIKYWLHSELFEHVPGNIVIIDKGYHIIKANKNFNMEFGDWSGKHCYEVYRGKKEPCPSCKADLTFSNGMGQVTEERRLNRNGNYSFYVVHFEPIKNKAGDIPYIIEISYNVTETRLLQLEHGIIFDRVPCYVAVIDSDMKIVRNNELFRKTFGESIGRKCYDVYVNRNQPCEGCPAIQTFNDGQIHMASKIGIDEKGQTIHYQVTTAPLSREGSTISHIIEMALDITEMKRLENEMLEAERLAAVGETVAGLAHGIKNVLMGLEGGMFVFNTGMIDDDQELRRQGWEMLQDSIERITIYVKDFLNFAKGSTPKVERVDPVAVAKEVFCLYKDVAELATIKFVTEFQTGIEPANLDHEGIHTCLTNLITNAIDACQMGDNQNCEIRLAVFERDGNIIYEVKDNGCGMNLEVKKKVFTTFFSTKGTTQGTGLGLLVTRKITQQHGGKVTVESIEGEGSIFRLEFLRSRLPELSDVELDIDEDT